MKDKKKRLQYPVYFESGDDNFGVDTNESDRVENLVGNINSVIKNTLESFVIFSPGFGY